MGAAIGNKYAVGANSGRPRMYEKVEDLQRACDEYFEYIKGEFHIEKRLVVEDSENGPNERVIDVEIWDREPEPSTVTGLALYLGFASRQSLADYEESNEFSYTIKRAKLRVENSYEISLRVNGGSNNIFGLKNMGWKDQSQKELSGPDGSPIFPTTLKVKKIDGSSHSTD